ncbi:MAG: acyltransferase family protein [Bacteroidales bacterium]|nr:acyltransferase family protein [Bacteroidales bacterium]
MKKDSVIEYMKGFTMLLVVLAHVSKMYTPKGAIPVNGENIILLYLTNFIYTFHMPVFVAISGMVFYICKVSLNKYNDGLAFVKNKFKRLIIPFITILFVIVVPVLHIVHLWGG